MSIDQTNPPSSPHKRKRSLDSSISTSEQFPKFSRENSSTFLEVTAEHLAPKTTLSEDYYISWDKCTEVGSGGSGSLHTCEKISNGCKYVAKFLPYYDPKTYNELTIWKACSPHENIVPLLDIYDTGVLPRGHALLGPRPPGRYLVAIMELMKGGDLFERVIASIFKEDHVIDIAEQVLAGLVHIHNQGFVLGDLKLENLLLETTTDDFRVRIADFGFARRETCPQGSLYSLSYISPEMIESIANRAKTGVFTPVGPASDVWGLGVCVYTMLTHNFPFQSKPNEHGHGDGITLTPYRKDCVNAAKIVTSTPSWKCLSRQAKLIVRTLLNPNPATRVSAHGAIELIAKLYFVEDAVAASSDDVTLAVSSGEAASIQYHASM